MSGHALAATTVNTEKRHNNNYYFMVNIANYCSNVPLNSHTVT